MRIRRSAITASAAIVSALALTVSLGAEPQYETGGPLAGVKLAPFATQHGEQPGYPGCLPERMREGEAVVDMGNEYRQWGPQGQAPERDLYNGSVEHWRAYMFKYMPVRSFFDRQSQLANFVAPDIPGVDPAQVEQYAEPLYWVPRHDDPRPTGRKQKPVPVVRMRVDSPVLKLDLGELDAGVYVVRVIGAVETANLRPFREPLFMRMRVNDGLDGGQSQYRNRIGYCDQFYSVAEFYFHAPAKRRYRAEVAADRGSKVDLLVHNISLDNVLAGTANRAIKRRSELGNAMPVAQAALAKRKTQGQEIPAPLSHQERLARDAAIWRGFPPPNAQGSGIGIKHEGYGTIRGVRAGSDELSGEEIVARWGDWVSPDQARDFDWPEGVRPEDAFLVNPKLKLVYTVGDLRAGRPLPDPYPLKDDGAGLYFPDADPETGAVWTPIGRHVHNLHRQYYQDVQAKLRRYKERGQYDDAHDAAVTLVRWAYAFPTLDYSRYLSNAAHDPGPFGRDFSCRRRATAANFLPHYQVYVDPIMYSYDELFDLIRGDQLLAESVGRFVPWVQTPEDVIRLIDVYLVQTAAKRILRYHYHTDPMDIANLAAVVGNREVTDPWMEWLFSRTFIYPLPVAGIQDVMISGTTREGTEIVGSTYYSQGEGALRVAASLDSYLAAGGNPRYDLSDPRRYPKPVAHSYWRLENVVAGGDFLRVGDVCGPDKVPGHTLRDLGFARHGWRWTGDPQFAFILKHYLGRTEETDDQWAAIEKAAAKQPRAPWLELRSRVLPMWAGVLEAGIEHDDYRFRRAAYLRLGYGAGHHHYDALDLQVVAHGLPMTVDGGQRPGYSVPGDRTTRVHNVVQVDGAKAYRHSWATALADRTGARYLAAEAHPPEGCSLYRRQIALVDVDQGSGSQNLPPERQKPGQELPRGVTTPNSYVLDVVRADGGSQQTYCFHGPLNDDFSWNATGVGPPAEGTEEAEYLSRFSLMPERNRVGDAPGTLTATWRMAVEVPGTGAGEKEMLGRNFDPDAPRKFTRLHVLGTDGCRAMLGEFVCRQWNYHFTNLMVRRSAAEGEKLDRPFVAVVETYVGEPFIQSCRELPVTDNEQDARRAVAIQVETRDGHTDACFADGRPDRRRTVTGAKLDVAGEFAFYSTDADGLRQATLVGGRSLETRLVRLEPEAAERRANVVSANYLDRTLRIDTAWPARSKPSVFEIGVPGHKTSYTATSIEPASDGTLIRLRRGADYFRSEITEVDPEQAIVTTVLKPMVDQLGHNTADWVASDDEAKTFWRATYLGARRFRLEGPGVNRDAFAPAGVLRLWECGAGDAVRQSTSVSLRRIEPDVFELTTDVAVKVSLPGRAMEASVGEKRLDPERVRVADGWAMAELPPSDLPIRLKIVR